MFESLSKWLFENYAWSSKWNVLSHTDIGQRRVNQDYHLNLKLKDHTLCLVADGLGGHHGGELAAQGYCKGLGQVFTEHEDSLNEYGEIEIQALCSSAIEYMTDYVSRQSTSRDAHTTIAGVLISDHKMIWFHLGDTRIYLLSDDVLSVTRDDSVMQRLMDNGKLDEANRMQNILEKSVSVGKPVEVNIASYNILDSDQGILICSDGLWDNLPQQELVDFHKEKPEKRDLVELVDKAKKAGGKRCDNITATYIALKQN